MKRLLLLLCVLPLSALAGSRYVEVDSGGGLAADLNASGNAVSNAVFYGDGSGITNATFAALETWGGAVPNADGTVTNYEHVVAQNITAQAVEGRLITLSAGYYKCDFGGRSSAADDTSYFAWYTNGVPTEREARAHFGGGAGGLRQAGAAGMKYLSAGVTNTLYYDASSGTHNIIDAWLILELWQ